MRPDLLSKRMFLAGLCGLPWLWVVHVLYWYGHQHEMEQERQNNLLVPPEQDIQEGDDGLVDGMTREEIELEQRKWVKRSRNAAILVIALWVSWICIFQALRDFFPASWYLRPPDDSAFTGW